jgi:hypothetical protein
MSAVTRNVLRNWSRRRHRRDSQVLSEWEVLGAEYWRAAEPERDPEASADQPYTEARNTFREIRARWQESGEPKEGALSEEYKAAELAFRKVVIERLHQHPRTALCFSGGGIRSATFGLGVLQGMAAHSCPDDAPASSPPLLLGELNYLSTVSGGGYLGGWFSSWASRHPLGSAGVIRELSSVPEAAWEPEPAPLRYLRKFASYLNPQLGAFSADTWTLAATVLRNVVLNWLVLLPLLAAVLVLPRLLYALVWTYPMIENDYLLLASAALLAASVAYMVLDLPSAGNARFRQRRFLIFGLAPILLSGIGFSLYWAWQGDLGAVPSVLGFVQYGILIMAVGVIIGMPLARWRRHAFSPKWMVQGAAFAVIAGAVGGVFCYWMTKSFTNPNGGDLYNEQLYTWLALPALLGVLALAQGLLVALTSTITSDEDREWWARAMAWIFISTVCCFSFSGMAIMAPNLAHYLPSLQWQSLATAAAGLLASRIGFSSKTAATAAKAETAPAESLPQIALKLASRLILPVLALLLVTLIATFNQAASLQVADWLRNLPQWSPFPALGIPTDRPSVTVELALMALLAVPPLVLARIIDANKFSLHAMYRARLIRTFLGASHNGRKPNPFTGFDPDDNVPMAKLPAKPLHVVNATLNLVKSDNLAWQERKAESFTATPYHTGSCRLGYQPSTEYFGNVTLGGAITVSGAAANPNMGYASSPVLSIVMMLFNARLGVWAPNPGEPGRGRWHKTGPTYSIMPFVDEAFGLTSDKNAWVNLSDGGHFENLGLYEMVLRRCRTIIVVDGSADPEFHFGDLGNAVRKIRIDMGIPIEFPDGISIGKQITQESRHWAVGTIGYQDVDGQGVENGVLLYLKASLTGNEPRDVKNYADQNTAFPHQSTADQWFDESQFESYRRLGYHAIEEVVGSYRGVCSLEDFANKIRSYCTGREQTATGRPPTYVY